MLTRIQRVIRSPMYVLWAKNKEKIEFIAAADSSFLVWTYARLLGGPVDYFVTEEFLSVPRTIYQN